MRSLQATPTAIAKKIKIELEVAHRDRRIILADWVLLNESKLFLMTIKTDLLKTSFALLQARKATFTDRFYTTLFTDYPMAKPLFANTDMEEQPKKLFASLVLVVNNLTKPDVLADTLKGLGARHIKYGVLPEHYPMVGSTLLKSMAATLGEQWNDEYAEAWTAAYAAIVEIMLDGAHYPPEILSPTPSTGA